MLKADEFFATVTARRLAQFEVDKGCEDSRDIYGYDLVDEQEFSSVFKSGVFGNDAGFDTVIKVTDLSKFKRSYPGRFAIFTLE